ncbi:hypothetical protein [Solidesulfovibrio sp. C21]|uniref:hypothetical protein n=1 Tax=Solidesulfovibrio sp. C21 TaxID=3398613 RepID=UPI0039FC572F
MLSRYAWSIILLCMVAAIQFWFMSVLLLSRQTESLLFCSIIAFIFWSWCFWAYFLRKCRSGLLLVSLCLLGTLAMSVLFLLDLLDICDFFLIGR